jgi:RNA polymerase sigma-70 factor (ECF subfamily)
VTVPPDLELPTVTPPAPASLPDPAEAVSSGHPSAGHASAGHPSAGHPSAGHPSAGDPDPADLGGLFDRYGAQLLRYCARRVGPDHAEDVVAETFLTAHAKFRSYDPGRSGPLPWLYGIATNLLRRHGRDEVQAYKALARTGARAERGGEEWDRAAERVDAFRARSRLAGALASLSRRQRDVLLLFAVAQLEYDEIAVAMDMPVGTVRSTLHRARAKVRSALGTHPARGGDE